VRLAAAALILLAVPLLASSARADELRVFEPHAVEGQNNGESYRGTLRIAEDASYELERTFPDGRTETEAGRARILIRALVLTPQDGPQRAYERADEREGRRARVRWRWEAPQGFEVLAQPGRDGGRLSAARRLLERPEGALNWILADNLGVVAETPLLLRSRQPTPSDIDRLVAGRGLRTVLSLNGDQDEVVWYVPGRDAPDALRRRGPRRVNLAEHLEALGVQHVTLSMSASRAPSPDELEAAFRVLLDPDRAPVLIHCRGGSDRTGVICALYAIEFQGRTKAEAKQLMREHMWAADDGTEIQGAYIDLYQPGSLRSLLEQRGVPLPR
jgi:protein tyrosine phosphatase (PTP) superfamily phosphohydrolase (DUF442 family)